MVILRPKAGSVEVKLINLFLANGSIYAITLQRIMYKDVLKAVFKFSNCDFSSESLP